MTQRINIFHYNNMLNELRSCHNKTNWVNSVWMQDFWMLMRLDSISWRKTLEISHNLIQLPVVNTLFQKKEAASHSEDWIQGNIKIGPVSKVAISYLHGKHGVEIRIMSLSRNNTHFWVRISHGSNKFVMDLNSDETEIPEDQLEEYSLKLNEKNFACRSKTKAKSQRREPADFSSRIVPIERKNWIDIESVNILSLRIWGIEESNLSFSSFTASASRRRRSDSFLENEEKSSESIS